MGEIKSAWEIAMEKAEKLGKLPPEELRRQKEEKYGENGFYGKHMKMSFRLRLDGEIRIQLK